MEMSTTIIFHASTSRCVAYLLILEVFYLTARFENHSFRKKWAFGGGIASFCFSEMEKFQFVGFGYLQYV